MLNDFSIFNIFCPWMAQQQQAKEEAIKTEANARKLNGLQPENNNFGNTNTVSLLKSANLLLERLLDRGDILTAKTETVEPNANKAIAKQIALEKATIIPPVKEVAREAELSETAKEIIKLRDLVLLTKTGDNANTPELLESLYQELGQVLEKEGVQSLEDTGSYNYEQQKVMATRVVKDPDKDDLICETVRPGYMFNGKLVRSQEVTIYTYNSSTGSEIRD